MHMEMINKQNGRRSVFESKKVTFAPNTKDEYFTTALPRTQLRYGDGVSAVARIFFEENDPTAALTLGGGPLGAAVLKGGNEAIADSPLVVRALVWVRRHRCVRGRGGRHCRWARRHHGSRRAIGDERWRRHQRRG